MNFPQLGALPLNELAIIVAISLVFVVTVLTFGYLLYAVITKAEQTKKAKYTRIAVTALGVSVLAVTGIFVSNQPRGTGIERYNASMIEYMDKSYGLTITKAETWKLLDLKPATVTTADGETEKVRLTSLTDEDPKLIGEDLTTIPKISKKAN